MKKFRLESVQSLSFLLVDLHSLLHPARASHLDVSGELVPRFLNASVSSKNWSNTQEKHSFLASNKFWKSKKQHFACACTRMYVHKHAYMHAHMQCWAWDFHVFQCNLFATVSYRDDLFCKENLFLVKHTVFCIMHACVYACMYVTPTSKCNSCPSRLISPK